MDDGTEEAELNFNSLTRTAANEETREHICCGTKKHLNKDFSFTCSRTRIYIYSS
jgi:hypothetical protein